MAAALSSVMNFNDPQLQTRALAVCVAVSIVLHAVILFLVPSMREGKQAASSTKILTARLSSRTAAPEPPRAEP